MAEDGSVKVAVRVRPFNSREKGMKAKLCLKMIGPTTIITHPESGKTKTFAFDFSYWSHDGYEEQDDGLLVATNPAYATQQQVYEDLGGNLLQCALEGYNASLFAYGQTGAGKSYSMVGYGVNRGIIPIFCEELFKLVESNPNKGEVEYRVTVSMLEIYNEQVRDLLNPKVNKKGGLKVRSRPDIGVYVEDLTPVAVSNYSEVEARMAEGTKNRTIAATQMNATSSRAHTVFTLKCTTVKRNEAGEMTEVSSKVNLVDLAGSERASSTGATGDRLKEGSAINQSLSALGNVISALAELSSGKKKKVFIPYRNSVLTRILQDALGGNSKTIMIAALSPADVNYDETLSTLRYADRAKKIKNKVVKNENPTDRLIRELKEENKKLKKRLAAAGGDLADDAGDDDAAIEAERKRYESQLEENRRLMEEMQKSWEQRLAEAQALGGGGGGGAVATTADSNAPSLCNLHPDPQMSEVVVYAIGENEDRVTRVGRPDAEVKQNVPIQGLNVKHEHALLTLEDGGSGAPATVRLQPAAVGNKIFVNGEMVGDRDDGVVLQHNDRIIFGNHFYFRYHDPAVAAELGPEEEKDRPTYSSANEEYTTAQGMVLQQSAMLGGVDMDKEEAQQRAALEERLRQMEEEVRREREKAKQALLEQKQLLEGSASLSSEEQARLQQLNAQFEATEEELEDQLAAKKRQEAERFEREQSSRKRAMHKVNATLGALIPQIDEANQIAKEMKRVVKFEPRLTIDSDAALSQEAADGELGAEESMARRIKITVRVTSSEDGSVWNWPPEKMENRLFVMRDRYSRFSANEEFEDTPATDPFWDPPEPIDIGKAFVFPKALSQLVEIDQEIDIVDHKGETQGQLKVEVFPEGPHGEELDYLDSPDDILGRDVTFVLRIPQAQNMTARYAFDTQLSYSFHQVAITTQPLSSFEPPDPSAKVVVPFNHEQRLRFTDIGPDMRDFLLTGAVVITVTGLSEGMVAIRRELAAASESNPNAGGPVCEHCEEASAAWDCNDCGALYCNDCFDLLHRSARKASHERHPVNMEPEEGAGIVESVEGADVFVQSAADSAAPTTGGDLAGGSGMLCQFCEENEAVVHCEDCDQMQCVECEELLHKAARKQSHVRVPLGAGGGAAAPAGSGAPCEQCEEETAIVQCEECAVALCGDCNELLHRAKRKKDHVRVQL